MVCGSILIYLEHKLCISGIEYDLYVGNIVLIIGMFIYCCNNPDKYNMPLLEYVGKNLSLYIYVFHVMVFKFVQKYDHPDVFWIYIFTTLLAYLGFN